MPPWRISSTQIYRGLIVGTLLLIVFLTIKAAWTALLPFFLGLFFAYLLLPAVNFLDRHMLPVVRRRGFSRPLSVIIVYIVGIGLVAGSLSYFIPTIIEQFRALIEAIPSYIVRLQSFVTEDVTDLLDRFPPQVREALSANLQQAAGTLLSALQTGVTVTLRTVSQTVGFIIGMVIIPFWLFYILNDHAKAQRAFYDLIPEKAREDVRAVMTIIDELLSSYIRGQLLLCLLVGAMAMVALAIIGVDLAILLGTIAGITELIPILGPFLGAIPAVLIALLDRPISALWVALAFVIIQQIENILLVPRIQGNAVRFHPAAVMVIVVIGGQVGGLWGVLLAVPVAAVIRDVARYLYLRTTERGATPQMALDAFHASNL